MEESSWFLWDWVISWWDWFVTGPDGRESGSTTTRNGGLLIGGFTAIVLAIWRNVISHRGLLNDRFQKGAEMLGNDVMAVRLAGIYSLKRLAEDEPRQYHLQIMRSLCAFVRNPTPAKNEKETDEMPTVKTIREDVQLALWIIAGRSKVGIEIEKKAEMFLDLRGADLSLAHLPLGNLTRWVLHNADLTNTILYKAKGLTQHELDHARAHPARPPNLNGAHDAETGKPLEWRKGKPKG